MAGKIIDTSKGATHHICPTFYCQAFFKFHVHYFWCSLRESPEVKMQFFSDSLVYGPQGVLKRVL